jgi:hypothetical protein
MIKFVEVFEENNSTKEHIIDGTDYKILKRNNTVETIINNTETLGTGSFLVKGRTIFYSYKHGTVRTYYSVEPNKLTEVTFEPDSKKTFVTYYRRVAY